MIVEGMSLVQDQFVFSKECYEDAKPTRKGVLRTIKGPVAEWGSINRNNRKYTEKLWDRVLASDYVKEQTGNKTLYGEANHPADRFDVQFSQVSHSIVEMYKVPEKNQVYATIDILDTPLGNILNVLYEYGSVLGYSSRAGGVLHNRKTHIDVDEDSYHFVTFDAVPYPSVITARPLNESGNVDSVRVGISEEAHTKILKIIEESGKNDKEVLKDFIYSLQDYDLDRELSVLEGLEDKKDGSDTAEVLKSTTLCLLKESYGQINSLRLEKSSVERQLEKTNESMSGYKSKLESALKKIQTLTEGSTTKEGDWKKVINENSTLKDDLEDTTKKNGALLDTIKEYEESLEDVDVKLLEMEVLKNDLRKVNLIIKEKDNEIEKLKSQINVVNEEKDTLIGEIENCKKFADYDEVSGELGSIVKEFNSLKENYNFNVEKLKKYESEIKRVNEDLTITTEKLTRTDEDIEKILTENVDLVKTVKGYKVETTKANETVNKLNGVVGKLNEKVEDYEKIVETYKTDLVRTICGNYGINPNKITDRLQKNFTSDDVHNLCEGASYSKGMELVSIIEDVVINPDDAKASDEKEIKKAKLSGMFEGSRRGKITK